MDENDNGEIVEEEELVNYAFHGPAKQSNIYLLLFEMEAGLCTFKVRVMTRRTS